MPAPFVPRRAALVLPLIAVLLVASIAGCYGKFPVTRAVYKMNGQASDNKLVNSLVMWVFALPLYAPGALTDLAVFNLVEFWTGATLKLGDDPAPAPARPPTPPRRWTARPSPIHGT